MNQTNKLRTTEYILYHFYFLLCFLFMLIFSSTIFAEGVFEKKAKNQYSLTGVELNRIKAEHQAKFGRAQSGAVFASSTNPWDRKKQQTQPVVSSAEWGECRDYALHKRNRCYRDGKDAYQCEQKYEARVNLCDNNL